MASNSESQTWDTFVRRPADLRLGTEVPLVLRNLRPGRTKYGLRHVVAVIHEGEGAGDRLLVRTVVGVALPNTYTVQIKKELPQEIPGTPYRDFYQALAKAVE
jgi:hypothetical protein